MTDAPPPLTVREALERAADVATEAASWDRLIVDSIKSLPSLEALGRITEWTKAAARIEVADEIARSILALDGASDRARQALSHDEGGWQPIETAPNLSDDPNDHVWVFGGARKTPWLERPDGSWWRHLASEGNKSVPTHWKPLKRPSPPAQEPRCANCGYPKHSHPVSPELQCAEYLPSPPLTPKQEDPSHAEG